MPEINESVQPVAETIVDEAAEAATDARQAAASEATPSCSRASRTG